MRSGTVSTTNQRANCAVSGRGPRPHMNRPPHHRRHRLDDPAMTVETRDRQSGLRSGFIAFSTQIAGRPLRPYQLEAANAILASIEGGMGETFVVMMARQMGKNELSAQLEAWLLDQASETGGTIVKAAPTFRPQLHTSLARLSGVLRHPRYEGKERFGAHTDIGFRLAMPKPSSRVRHPPPTSPVSRHHTSLKSMKERMSILTSTPATSARWQQPPTRQP